MLQSHTQAFLLMGKKRWTRPPIVLSQRLGMGHDTLMLHLHSAH
jgi:hypothetical protein